jgi:hypothetical protein
MNSYFKHLLSFAILFTPMLWAGSVLAKTQEGNSSGSASKAASILAKTANESNGHIEYDVPNPSSIQQALAQQNAANVYHFFSHGRSGELLIDGEWKNAEAIAN